MLIRITFLTALFTLLSVLSVSARQTDLQSANRLMQQQNYEQAIPVLTELHEQNPQSNVYFERLVEALISFDDLERAEEVVRNQIDRGITTLQASAKLGEILHLKNQREEALSVWREALEENQQNIQATYIIASSMTARQEFDEAVKAYRAARENHNNDTLFLNELANAYLLAGRFDDAVNEYFQLIMEAPQQMSIVQQRFFQMRDEELYDIASFELEDLLIDLSPSHEAYSSLYQLLSWLLIETQQYDRAYNIARYYEEETSYTIYALFELGSRLASAGQYSLAEKAFTYYLNDTNGTISQRAADELSNAYLKWARFAEQNNVVSSDSIRTLYQNSYTKAEELIHDFPDYEQSDRVLSRLTDLSLDVEKSADKASQWLQMLSETVGSDNPYTLYAEGRVAMFEERFGESRRLLAAADRATEQSNLSEKARYYAALSDFFSGDPEFAEIQLRSLERRNSSYFANDAIKLRMWIQDGLRADTTGAELKQIGLGFFKIHSGNYDGALADLNEILNNPQHPFSDKLVIECSSELPDEYSLLKLTLLQRQIERNSQSPLMERIMWDYALLAEQIAAGRIIPSVHQKGESYVENEARSISFSMEEVESLFEELIITYPDGFYATYAREKLQQLQNDYL